ncbi:MAG: hypothetical protein BMS9Abin09_0805 [Gammaproteobacteria bacterium]|nr:MAG: hypothetical protein BMS9Abin09_0805 [Gammaproteobacteria bacterium]
MARILMEMAEWFASHPKKAVVLILSFTLGFLSCIPLPAVDDEVLNMLPAGHTARILQERIEKEFGTRDFVALVVENPDGVFNFESLARYMALSGFLVSGKAMIEGALSDTMHRNLRRLGPVVIVAFLALLTLCVRRPSLATLP